MQEIWVWSVGQEDPLQKEMGTTPVFLPGKSHGKESLACCDSWGRKESDTTEQLNWTQLNSNFNNRGKGKISRRKENQDRTRKKLKKERGFGEKVAWEKWIGSYSGRRENKLEDTAIIWWTQCDCVPAGFPPSPQAAVTAPGFLKIGLPVWKSV